MYTYVSCMNINQIVLHFSLLVFVVVVSRMLERSLMIVLVGGSMSGTNIVYQYSVVGKYMKVCDSNPLHILKEVKGLTACE